MLLAMLEPWPGASVLDVGGGHGQYTELLADHGYQVTVLGSSPDADVQVRTLVDSGRCAYRVGDLCRLPTDDRSFDVVVSFRLLAHLEDWRSLVKEAGRVARRAVVVDVPVLKSANALYPALFWLKRLLEGESTRPFLVFREKDILEAFQEANLQRTGRVAQYLFPMVLHRALHLPRVSRAVERACESVGLTRRFGSPVILRLEPALRAVRVAEPAPAGAGRGAR